MTMNSYDKSFIMSIHSSDNLQVMIDDRQVELLQLQREFRHMELNRRAYSEESQSLLRKQQQTIDSLRNENDQLRNDISKLTRYSTKPLSIIQQETLHRLNEQKEKFIINIQNEKERIKLMENEILLLKKKVMEQRKQMGGINAIKENHYMLGKQIHILENRLDKSLTTYNEYTAYNKKLLLEIEDLRHERIVFENIYQRMEYELQQKKKEMSEIIEISNQAYEKRDTFQMEIAAIEQANRKEQEEFDDQMIELARLLDNDLALPPPSRLGNTNIFNSTSNRNRKSLRQSIGNKGNTTTNTPIYNISNAADTIIIEPIAIQRLENFEKAFKKIRIKTGINDIDELVKVFIKNEDHNFSLFNYINEQNNDIEQLEEKLHQLQDEEKELISKSNIQDDDDHITDDSIINYKDNSMKQYIKELQMKLQSTESMYEKYEYRCQDLLKIIENVKFIIQVMIQKLQLQDLDEMFLLNSPSIKDTTNNSSNTRNDNGGIEERQPLEDSTKKIMITDSNMTYYLGLVEKKTNQLMEEFGEYKQYMKPMLTQSNKSSTSIVSIKEDEDIDHSMNTSITMNQKILLQLTSPMKNKDISLLGSGPSVPMGQELIHVNPPKVEDYTSDDEIVDENGMVRPFTIEELKSRTINKISHKVNKKSHLNSNNNSASLFSSPKASTIKGKNISIISTGRVLPPTSSNSHSNNK